jgi:hypothetical protein
LPEHRRPQQGFCLRHVEAQPSASARGVQPGYGPLANDVPFKLCQRGKDVEDEFAGGGNRLDLLRDRFQSDCRYSLTSRLATLSLSRLPVAFRPYPDEALTSWLSRAAAVYGYTSRELLSTYRDFEREKFENVDLQPNPAARDFIQALVGGSIDKLRACTLSTVYPHWVPNWIGRTPPLWHTNESRTVATVGLCPATCPFCLIEDLESGRSQHLRLSWYCSITTVCPIHRNPLFTCCSRYSSQSVAHGQDRLQSQRLFCT